jgi:hypothetical protein
VCVDALGHEDPEAFGERSGLVDAASGDAPAAMAALASRLQGALTKATLLLESGRVDRPIRGFPPAIIS